MFFFRPLSKMDFLPEIFSGIAYNEFRQNFLQYIDNDILSRSLFVIHDDFHSKIIYNGTWESPKDEYANTPWKLIGTGVSKEVILQKYEDFFQVRLPQISVLSEIIEILNKAGKKEEGETLIRVFYQQQREEVLFFKNYPHRDVFEPTHFAEMMRGILAQQRPSFFRNIVYFLQKPFEHSKLEIKDLKSLDAIYQLNKELGPVIKKFTILKNL